MSWAILRARGWVWDLDTSLGASEGLVWDFWIMASWSRDSVFHFWELQIWPKGFYIWRKKLRVNWLEFPLLVIWGGTWHFPTSCPILPLGICGLHPPVNILYSSLAKLQLVVEFHGEVLTEVAIPWTVVTVDENVPNVPLWRTLTHLLLV